MITNEQVEAAARGNYFHKTGRMIAECSRPDMVIGFVDGVKWALEQQQNDLHSALKGLGLDKHNIALNVLRIAGIDLPKPRKDETNN